MNDIRAKMSCVTYLTNIRQFFLVTVVMLAGILAGNASLLASGTPGYTWRTTLPVNKPTAVTCDAEERIYVAEASRNQVLVLDMSGRVLHVLNGLAKPVAVAVDDRGLLFVGCQESGEVKIFAPDFTYRYSLGRGPGEFQLLTAVAVRPNGLAYVADGMTHEIRAYGSNGTPAFSFGGRGSDNGRFTYPVALAVHEATSEIVIADLQTIPSASYPVSFRGARIQVFSLDGLFKRKFGLFGQGAGRLTMPIGVAVDSMERIYVSDSYQNVVQIFDSAGIYLDSVFSLESPLRNPLDLCIGPVTGNLYVAAAGAGSVEVYGLPFQYSVVLEAEAGGRISPSEVQTVQQGANLKFTVTPESGYVISEVLLDGVNLGPVSAYTITGIIADHQVQARFVQNRFRISAAAGPHGMVSPDGVSFVSAGSDLHLFIKPDPGFRVGSLLVDDQAIAPINEYDFHNISSNHTLVVEFVSLPQLITSSASGCGRQEPAGVISVETGDDLIIAMTPDPGCRLLDVLLDDISQGPVSSLVLHAITAPHYIQARFVPVPVFSISTMVSGSGMIDPPGPLQVMDGASPHLAFLPDSGFEISDLIIDGFSHGPLSAYTFPPVHGDHTVTVVFAPQVEKAGIDIRVSGAGEVQVLPENLTCPPACSFDPVKGAEVVLQPRPLAGSVFVSWLAACEDEAGECTLTLTDNVMVQALFAPEDNLEDFRSGDFSRFPWQTSGSNGWRIISAGQAGSNFATPSPSLLNGQAATLEVELEVVEPGFLLFDFTFLQEHAGTLHFFMDNKELGQWIPDSKTTRPLFSVSNGRHRFRWEFRKNAAPGAWSALLRLNRIIFPASVGLNNTAPDLKINGADGPLSLDNGASLLLSPFFSLPDTNGSSPAWGLLLQSSEAFFFFDPVMNRWKKAAPELTLFAPLFAGNAGESPEGQDVAETGRSLIPALYNVLNNTVIRQPQATPAGPLRTYEASGDFLLNGLPPGEYTFYLGIAQAGSGRGPKPVKSDRVQVLIRQ